MAAVAVFLLAFVWWVIWASCSTGGLHELKEMNPEFAHPNRHVAFLVSKLNYSPDNGYWDAFHVRSCSLYMPNWAKAERCVDNRIYCELQAPRDPTTDPFIRDKRVANVLSDQFESCAHEGRPSLGPSEYIRASRMLWRAVIAIPPLWGLSALSSSEYAEWEKSNAWWVKPLGEWVERAE